MNEIISELLKVQAERASSLAVIPWSSPIVGFGDLQRSRLATLGINPSNREFTCTSEKELSGSFRRFPTLTSLGLSSWNASRDKHNMAILEACKYYFSGVPYDLWFGKLDSIIRGTGFSFYRDDMPACHLDLVPWATHKKWSFVEPATRRELLKTSAPYLGRILNASAIQVLVLNGQSVTNGLFKISEFERKVQRMKNWDLPRKASLGVPGYAYEGKITSIGGIRLRKTIHFLGYNHNLQSSFGVTKKIQDAIGNWVAQKASAYLKNGKETKKSALLR